MTWTSLRTPFYFVDLAQTPIANWLHVLLIDVQQGVSVAKWRRVELLRDTGGGQAANYPEEYESQRVQSYNVGKACSSPMCLGEPIVFMSVRPYLALEFLLGMFSLGNPLMPVLWCALSRRCCNKIIHAHVPAGTAAACTA